MSGAPVTPSSDFQGVYASAPVPLWIEDYSGIKRLLDRLRADGVADLRSHLATHPELVDTAIREIRVLDVNTYTLQLYRADSREQLLERLDDVFRLGSRTTPESSGCSRNFARRA